MEAETEELGLARHAKFGFLNSKQWEGIKIFKSQHHDQTCPEPSVFRVDKLNGLRTGGLQKDQGHLIGDRVLG